MLPTVFPDPYVLGRALAAMVADGLEEAAREGRPYVLGCPGGRSARTTYRALADEVARRGLDLRPLTVAMMDEYVVEGAVPGEFRPVDHRLPHSCLRFGREEITGPLNTAAGKGRSIEPDRLWVPDPSDPESYDKRLADLGGIDLFILATGAGDGHVAFNAPGTPAGTRTHVARLAEQTRRDNLVTFPTFDGLDDVPLHGVTVGVGTIREQSRRTVLVAHGPDKAAAANRLAAAVSYEPDWPATVLSDCARPDLFLDASAAHAL
ncbi:6-phosphogluconolactonase [Streptomyces sp. NPDC058695]|uniref:6-phosphogluconolactonase n=1 Tax=Streptomyces sp. NPDC058695 TaxID=3346604 RepID=UPI00365ABB2A